MMNCTIYASCKSSFQGQNFSSDNFYFNGTSLKKENTGNNKVLDQKLSTENELYFGVFEGFGKVANQASYMSAKLLGHFIEKLPQDHTRYSEILRRYSLSSGKVIYNTFSGYESYSSMGVCCIVNDGLYVASNGTVKAFIQRENDLKELSGHSNSYLGNSPVQSEPIVVSGRIEVGDRIVICSKAVSEEISAEYFNEILSVEDNAASCAERLAEECLGGADTVTVIVIDVLDAEGTPDHLLADFFAAPVSGKRARKTVGRDDELFEQLSSEKRVKSDPANPGKKSSSNVVAIVTLILFLVVALIIAIAVISNPKKTSDVVSSSGDVSTQSQYSPGSSQNSGNKATPSTSKHPYTENENFVSTLDVPTSSPDDNENADANRDDKPETTKKRDDHTTETTSTTTEKTKEITEQPEPDPTTKTTETTEEKTAEPKIMDDEPDSPSDDD